MEEAVLHEAPIPVIDEPAKTEKAPAEMLPEVSQDSVPDTSANGDPQIEDLNDNDDASSVVAPNPPVLSKETDMLREVKDELNRVNNGVSETAEMARRTASEIKEIHKLYHNEFASRLKSMQEELDEYHKVDRGRAFDGILSAIARIYGNNETLVEEITDAKTNKHIQYLLLDLLDLLEEYGVQRIKSNPGDRRNTRHSQVLERIPISDEAKHDTVAKSHNSGFAIGNRTITKEIVDIYLFDKGLEIPSQKSGLPVCGTSTTETEQNS